MENGSSSQVLPELNPQITQSQPDLGDQEEECVQALELLRGHDVKDSNMCIKASQSQTDLGDQAEECVQTNRVTRASARSVTWRLCDDALKFLKGHDWKQSNICTQASQSKTDIGDEAEECAQALRLLKGGHGGQSKVFTQASQSQKEHGKQVEECVQALKLLKGHNGKQSTSCRQVQSKVFTQASQSQKEHGKQVEECVQALKLLKGHNGKQSTSCRQVQSKVFTQASQSQKEHGKQVEECVQALKLLKGHNGKQSTRCRQVFINRKPKWLARFLQRTFFYPCPKHYTGRNELNQYCIDCDTPLCKSCLSISPSPHDDHRRLKLYRHIYKDVALLDELKRHIDCSQIQPYKCNKQVVLALTPLPHTGAKTKEEARCYTCKRRLFQYDSYNYCSISCKVVAFSKKKNESDPPFLSIQEPEKPIVSNRRKGIPQQSPFI